MISADCVKNASAEGKQSQDVAMSALIMDYMAPFLVHPDDLVDDGIVVREAGSVIVTVTVVGLAVQRDEVGVGSTQGPPSMKNFSDCAYITYTLVPLMAEN